MRAEGNAEVRAKKRVARFGVRVHGEGIFEGEDMGEVNGIGNVKAMGSVRLDVWV